MAFYQYSRWDGTQNVFPFDADAVLDALSEDLIDGKDLSEALQSMYRWGMDNDDPNQRIPGLQDLLEQLRARREEEMLRYDLDSVMQDIREKLENIVAAERNTLQNKMQEAAQQEDKMLRQMMEKTVQKKEQQLDKLPRDPGGQMRSLFDYEFMDADARDQFQELMQQIQQQILSQYFQGMKQSMENITQEDIGQMREMIQDLNQMLQDKAAGKEPKFQQFMQKWGQYFPPGITSLDELLKHMQKQMAQMQSLMDSMSPEQRRQLQSMMDNMLRDNRIRLDLAQLAQNLEQMMPMRGMRQRYPFAGEESLTMQEAMDLMARMQQMDQLEKDLKNAQYGNGLQGLDPNQISELLGPEAGQNVDQLQQLMRVLEEAGYAEKKGNRWELTPRGMRKIGNKALRDIFAHLKKDSFGKHKTVYVGNGGERTDVAKKYEFGDPFLLDLEKTVMNGVFRNGPSAQVQLEPDDFEVYRTEAMTSSSTVLMLDMSRSMILRGCWSAAKKTAMALNSLIRSQYPRDSLYIIGFSDRARLLQPEELTQITWNEYVYGTNMQHGFMMARQLLARHKGGNKQIIMITDGEPTAHLEEGSSQPFFSYPPTQRTFAETLKEVTRCTREQIVINTFMLEKSRYLTAFVEQMTKINKGRAFYSGPEALGEYILVDYVASKRKKVK